MPNKVVGHVGRKMQREARHKNITYGLLLAIFILYHFVLYSHEVPFISSKGDDGEYWLDVYAGGFNLHHLYPNIAFLSTLHSILGWNGVLLFYINMFLQILVVGWVVANIFKLEGGSLLVSILSVVWFLSNPDVFFVSNYLMRDVYILLILQMLLTPYLTSYGHAGGNRINTILTPILLVLRPSSLLILSYMFKLKTVFYISMLLFCANYLTDNLLAKAIVMPAAIFSNVSEFELGDVLAARENNRIESGEYAGSSRMISFVVNTFADISRPLLLVFSENPHYDRNGLTGDVKYNLYQDPLILVSNIAWFPNLVITGLILSVVLLLGLNYSLKIKSGKLPVIVFFYLGFYAVYGYFSSSARHFLMFSWLEIPILLEGFKTFGILKMLTIGLIFSSLILGVNLWKLI